MSGSTNNLVLRFRVFRGEELIAETELSEQSISIGTAEDALLRIDDSSVGQLHAVINVEQDGTVQLLDLGTGSGTHVNGETVSNATLRPGDSFELGDIRIQVDWTQEAQTDQEPAAVEQAVSLLAREATIPDPSDAPPIENPDERDELPPEDVIEFVMRSGTARSNLGVDPKKPRVLEINQVWGQLLLDTRHFAKGGRPVTIGASSGFRWNFLGINLGWVRSPFDSILSVTPPIWSEVTTESRNDFYTPDQHLPDNQDFTLAKWRDNQYAANIAANWEGFADVGEQRMSFDELVEAGRATKTATGYIVPITDDMRLVIDINGVIYFAHMVQPGKRVLSKLADDVDYPMMAIFLFCMFLGSMFGVIMYFTPPPAENEMMDIPDRFVELLLERPEPEKQKKKDIARDPEAEGAKAKKEEGKVGKKDAKMEKAKGNKKEVDKAKKDREIAENAGVLGAMRDAGDLDGVFGTSGLDQSLTGGIGGLIGAKGTQIGAGGLGSRGSGLGGGGTAGGLGGLGTKGIGSGSAGFGSGGGNIGRKGTGNISAVGGDPIILGALDRSLIDEVIKRSMPQIRYCYQRELTKDPSLSGKVVIKFTIAKDGSVSQASTKTSTLGNAGTESCVVGRFYRMQFPEPKGGGVVIVSYPFLFSPG